MFCVWLFGYGFFYFVCLVVFLTAWRTLTRKPEWRKGNEETISMFHEHVVCGAVIVPSPKLKNCG